MKKIIKGIKYNVPVKRPRVKYWSPLQFIVDMVHATRVFLRDIIKSRKWRFIYRKEKKDGSKTHIEIHYNE